MGSLTYTTKNVKPFKLLLYKYIALLISVSYFYLTSKLKVFFFFRIISKI